MKGEITSFSAIIPLKPGRNTQDTLAVYLHTDMPKIIAKRSDCENACAGDIGAYILNGFSDELKTGDHIVVTESVRAERVAKGDKFYRDPKITCVVCHGNDGTLTATTNGKSLENCDACTSWESLRDYIDQYMPPLGGGGAVSPLSCSIENTCANRTADWIWSQVNGWALTTLNGKDSGIKVTTENRFGQDTVRQKTYRMLSAHFTRIFGAAPTVLTGSKAAFRPEPEMWHTEGETGAVSMNVLVNASIQACGKETLPAINAAALRTSCADWAKRMWLRDATEAELQSCADVALIDTAGINDAKVRATYACVSMMTSLPALTY